MNTPTSNTPATGEAGRVTTPEDKAVEDVWREKSGHGHEHWTWKCPKESGGCGYQTMWYAPSKEAAPAAVTIKMLAGVLAAHVDLLTAALGNDAASVAAVPTEIAGMRRAIDLLKLHKSQLLSPQRHADLIRTLGSLLAALTDEPAAEARQDGAAATECSCGVLRAGPGRHLPQCPNLEEAAHRYECSVQAADDAFRDDPARRDAFLTTGPGAPSPHALAVAQQILRAQR
ncbi:hypothetical protein [Streptomyces sp. AD55]|uniref:hypothetical protein n=1 Tax=Streptomyces sp. AD55 TaxID=3242895 RepID=UPI003529D0DE